MSTRGLLAVATALTGSALSLALVTPMAHASPVYEIATLLKNDRGKYAPQCPPLIYNADLEALAQKVGGHGDIRAQDMPTNYKGQVVGFSGVGDPMDEAVNHAYQGGAGPQLSNCDFTDLGVSFYRDEDDELDLVGIVFGKPAAPPPPPPQAPPPPPPPQQAPPPPDLPPSAPVPVVAPHDAIQVNITRAGFNVNVNVKNTADLAGKCTYVANPTNNPLLPTVNRTFDIAAKGSTQLTFTAPPPLSTYHVVVSCRGSFNGKDVEFGHVEKDVSG